MDTWIAILGGLLTTIISGFSGWFFTKKKYNAEVDNNLINNMQESLEFYKALADDNKRRLEEVLLEVPFFLVSSGRTLLGVRGALSEELQVSLPHWPLWLPWAKESLIAPQRQLQGTLLILLRMLVLCLPETDQPQRSLEKWARSQKRLKGMATTLLHGLFAVSVELFRMHRVSLVRVIKLNKEKLPGSCQRPTMILVKYSLGVNWEWAQPPEL